MLWMGVDCGTQSLKVVLWSPERGVVGRAAASYGLLEGLGPGQKEQRPEVWVEALESCVASLRRQGVSLAGLAGIGVGGQQHGLVALDAGHRPVRPALLWNDTSTTGEVEALLEAAGGMGAWAAATGHFLPVGYTASKLRALRDREPAAYARTRHVMLPHDYLNLYLSGVVATEAGDASGTGLLDVRRRAWSPAALRWLDPTRDVGALLPPLHPSDAPLGRLRAEVASRWGAPASAQVAPGSGDNMMGALGTGNTREGVVTVSLGTSGTVYAYRGAPGLDPELEASAFCDATGGWLPLASTLATTVATEMVRRQLMPGVELAAFSDAVAAVPAGAEGLLLLPCLEGERTPDLPEGTGVLLGLRPATCHPAHIARAAMEGATLALRYCLEALERTGVEASEVRLTGGGARSAPWRQICAEVFEAPVVGLQEEEGTAFGAALHAFAVTRGEAADAVAQRFVALDEQTRAEPTAGGVACYRQLYGVHRRLLESLVEGQVFSMARRLNAAG